MAPHRVLPFALVLALATTPALRANAQAFRGPDTLVVQSDGRDLRGLLYRPQGPGPFPAVLFNHGSGHATGIGDHRHPELLGPLFARHGYAFLYLYRRGDGLSRGQGAASADLMDSAFATGGQEARNRIQIHLLENGDLNDALAGLAALRALPDVDARRTAVVGHSFGGTLSMLVAERDSSLRATVIFSGSGLSWNRSPELRGRLRAAVARVRAPVFFIHAANDYSTAPGESLAIEMKRLGKSGRVKIYPPIGRTSGDGHDFIHLGVSAWEPDVFSFLDPLMKK